MEASPAQLLLGCVYKVISDETHTPLGEINADTPIRSLVSDSLELTSLIVELETHFSMNIERRDLGAILTVRDLVSFITQNT